MNIILRMPFERKLDADLYHGISVYMWLALDLVQIFIISQPYSLLVHLDWAKYIPFYHNIHEV